ncbi:MAG: bifunctional hydroxymethylpyrimidine kinase/phosphomethylpyrimidine kinase [Candidatus Eisenbacteria sp.]|nr:bifunctional hydroxymethylpyrimidine kinase/phosphomethylpyrimidine kinase [Candidatus Eisenbacteria bacterium]
MDRNRKPPVVLAIGGSDPSGGAGIQADLKTIHALGGYAVVALTAVTVQNTQGVRETLPLPAGIVRAQIENVFADVRVGAVKTGMLANEEIVGLLAETLAAHRLPLVVDPVLASSGGEPLLDETALKPLKERLLPLATVCTPNWSEAAILAGHPVETIEDAQRAAERIRRLGPRAVLIKGGHAQGGAPGRPGDSSEAPPVVDLLLGEEGFQRFEAPRIAGPSPHGTGCLFGAAIATGLAAGATLEAAVTIAKRLVGDSITHSLTIGRGTPVVDPFHTQPTSLLDPAEERKSR